MRGTKRRDKSNRGRPRRHRRHTNKTHTDRHKMRFVFHPKRKKEKRISPRTLSRWPATGLMRFEKSSRAPPMFAREGSSFTRHLTALFFSFIALRSTTIFSGRFGGDSSPADATAELSVVYCVDVIDLSGLSLAFCLQISL